MASLLRIISVRFLIPVKTTQPSQRFLSSRLAEVGLLEPIKTGKSYETGQLFLHRKFGYRGVVLFPWLARVFDRDTAIKREDKGKDEHTTSVGKEVKGKKHLYYQVLMDDRDCPHLSISSDSVTILGNQPRNRYIYPLQGMDFVDHDDMLPYSSSEKAPICHELFDKFLLYDPESAPPYMMRERLRAWQDENRTFLHLSEVHRETTENIQVSVIPFYMGCRESQQSHDHFWRYCVQMENLGTETVQLRERHWRIFSLSGNLETVKARGVVGKEPILSPEQPAFQYSSHISLNAPSGHMWGTYKMERRDGTTFDCKIPPFNLDSKSSEPEDNSSPHGFIGS